MTIKITTDEAQYSAIVCCGENAPNLEAVTESNVIEIRNRFLTNVAFNGSRSHPHIIKVLQWMSQLITDEEPVVVPPEIKIIGYKYTTGSGWLFADKNSKLVCISIDHQRGSFLEIVNGLPIYKDVYEASVANPHLKTR